MTGDKEVSVLLPSSATPKKRWQIASNTSKASSSSALPIAESLRLRAQEQLEFYFCDANLRKDEFMQARAGASGDGFIKISEFRNFKRLVSMVADVIGLSVDDLVLAGASGSLHLQLSQDALSMRRVRPLPELTNSHDEAGCALLSGKIPNMFWCAIAYDELRCQRHFLPLPPVNELELRGPGTWHWVRQDDPLWGQLHWGVLTARHLAGALGLHEPRSAAFLDIPHHMRSHQSAVHVYKHLMDAQEAFESSPWQACADVDAKNEQTRFSWVQRCCGHSLISSARAGLKRRQQSLRAKSWHELSQVQCGWGTTQEPTALKKLLESLAPPCACLEEVGLAMIDPETSSSNRVNAPDISQARRWSRTGDCQSSKEKCAGSKATMPLLMGASPDAMLRFSDGTRAAVEVKNVCPFIQNGNRFQVCSGGQENSQSNPKHRGPAQRLRANQVPQVQWEMLATGTNSNYFLSASACQGINLFVVHRHEGYLQLMLRLISEFYTEFVLHRQAPRADFFWGRPHYLEFLELTRSISAGTVLARRLPSICDVQIEHPFLDNSSS